jgi:ABC-type antimicrobial peptide transport system permease subunit
MAYDVMITDLVGLKQLWIVPYGIDSQLSRTLYTQGIVWESGHSQALQEFNTPGSENPTPTNAVPPVILSQAAARFLEVTLGDEVQVAFHLGADRSQGRFRVTGIISAFPGLENFRARVANAVGSGALIAMQDFQRFTQAAPSTARQSIFFLKTAAGASKKAAQFIRDRFDVRYQFGVQCAAETKEHVRALYWVTQVFFALLLAVAVIIAVFALIASMASTVLERQREIGILKALGLRRNQLFKLFLIEAVILTLSAGIGGGLIGFGLAWLFVFQASVLMEIAAVFTMPYVTFAATILISLFAGALSAHLPTRSLLRKTAAEILRA